MHSEVEKLVARLRHLVSLNEPWNGGPYQGVAATACVEAMDEAASLIERLYREREHSVEAVARAIAASRSVDFDELDESGSDGENRATYRRLAAEKIAARALAGEDVQG
jgi:hypothetical protein